EVSRNSFIQSRTLITTHNYLLSYETHFLSYVTIRISKSTGHLHARSRLNENTSSPPALRITPKNTCTPRHAAATKSRDSLSNRYAETKENSERCGIGSSKDESAGAGRNPDSAHPSKDDRR